MLHEVRLQDLARIGTPQLVDAQASVAVAALDLALFARWIEVCAQPAAARGGSIRRRRRRWRKRGRRRRRGRWCNALASDVRPRCGARVRVPLGVSQEQALQHCLTRRLAVVPPSEAIVSARRGPEGAAIDRPLPDSTAHLLPTNPGSFEHASAARGLHDGGLSRLVGNLCEGPATLLAGGQCV